ncbi:MAG: GTPase [Clostridia bacterium]|nr:GTPase [Clostridia bacterium]
MSKKMPTAVFIINGFLESGKTTFIKNAIIKDPEIKKEKVLIVCCEEGEEEYTGLADNVTVHTVEDETELTVDMLEVLNEKYSPTYVIIEYNGVWEMQSLYRVKLPDNWRLAEQITVIDALTFDEYFQNMKSIFSNMLRSSSRIFVKRCTAEDNFKIYRDNIKRCNAGAEIVYMSDSEGVLNITLEDDLPYSLDDDIIKIDHDSYFIWYVDVMENTHRYIGKTVEYTGQVAKPGYFRGGYFVAGNMVMTCCEDDMQFLGFLSAYSKSDMLKEGSYVRVRGTVAFEYAPEYNSEGPVLHIIDAVEVPKPETK